MAVELAGNIPAPHNRMTTVSDEEELLYSTVGYTQKGVTLKPGQGVLLAGTILTQDAETKQYVKLSDPATQTPSGFLRRAVNTADTDRTYQSNIVIMGLVKLSVVLKGNDVTEVPAGVLTALNARVDAVRDFISF